MVKRTPAIVQDFRRSPVIYFKKKRWADEAKEQATKHGIRTRLTQGNYGQYRYKLTKVK